MTTPPSLLEADALADPFEQFSHWFDHALAYDFIEPTAMALATADTQGRPSLRMVLLKGHDTRGFVFYTNYASRKGEDLAANAQAALLWWWDKLQRQIRIEGSVEQLSQSESEAYFHSRPRGAQLSARASPQSRVVADRDYLEKKVAVLDAQYTDQVIPLPEAWGGYRVIPESFEFWQGRRDRLHDRLRYQKDGKHWRMERLGP